MALETSSTRTLTNEVDGSTASERRNSDTVIDSEFEGLLDPNVVWWDEDNDPEHPYNWPRWRTMSNCFLISAMTFLTALASCKATTALHTTTIAVCALTPIQPSSHPVCLN